jgi:fructosamine-3-kinase
VDGAPSVGQVLSDELGINVASVDSTAGGDINDAFRVNCDDGRVLFVKTSAAALPGVFEDEAAGLEWLAEPGGVAAAKVAGVFDPTGEADGPRLLALDWIERGSLGRDGEEQLGHGLARMHAAGAPAFGATPLRGGGYANSPMRFNQLALPNDPCDTWAEFYATRRILPLARAAAERGVMPDDGVNAIDRLAARLPDLAGPAEAPARAHGDLWSGNVMANAEGAPILIDPVAHGGHREVDLALLRLFGGPSERCYRAYEEVSPLSEGHSERIVLWQIGMILLHAYLLGGSYGAQAVSMARRYL